MSGNSERKAKRAAKMAAIVHDRVQRAGATPREIEEGVRKAIKQIVSTAPKASSTKKVPSTTVQRPAIERTPSITPRLGSTRNSVGFESIPSEHKKPTLTKSKKRSGPIIDYDEATGAFSYVPGKSERKKAKAIPSAVPKTKNLKKSGSFAPVSMVNNSPNYFFNETSHGSNSKTFSGCDILGTLNVGNNSEGEVLFHMDVNPVNLPHCESLRREASMWESYTFQRITVMYVTSEGTSDTGRIIGAFDMDSADTVSEGPNAVADLYPHQGAKSTQLWVSCAWTMPRPLTGRFYVDGPLDTPADKRLSNQATFTIVTDVPARNVDAGSTIGRLYVYYEVRFEKRRLNTYFVGACDTYQIDLPDNKREGSTWWDAALEVLYPFDALALSNGDSLDGSTPNWEPYPTNNARTMPIKCQGANPFGIGWLIVPPGIYNAEVGISVDAPIEGTAGEHTLVYEHLRMPYKDVATGTFVDANVELNWPSDNVYSSTSPGAAQRTQQHFRFSGAVATTWYTDGKWSSFGTRVVIPDDGFVYLLRLRWRLNGDTNNPTAIKMRASLSAAFGSPLELTHLDRSDSLFSRLAALEEQVGSKTSDSVRTGSRLPSTPMRKRGTFMQKLHVLPDGSRKTDLQRITLADVQHNSVSPYRYLGRKIDWIQLEHVARLIASRKTRKASSIPDGPDSALNGKDESTSAYESKLPRSGSKGDSKVPSSKLLGFETTMEDGEACDVPGKDSETIAKLIRVDSDRTIHSSSSLRSDVSADTGTYILMTEVKPKSSSKRSTSAK